MSGPSASLTGFESLELLTTTSGPLQLAVAPVLAGRVARLTFRGHALYVGPEVHPNNWGATYWTSPQADWGWPPVPEVDSAPYRVESTAEGVTLISPSAQIGKRHFVVRKTFLPGPHPGSIDALYSIENLGAESFSMANWEIARVPGGGITFFPTGARELTPIAPHAPMPTEKVAETTFYDHGQIEPGVCQKLHADGVGGYLAHVFPATEERGALLMLKLFRDTGPDEQAPGEGECEIFGNDDGLYVEVEVQGPYLSIAPGTSSILRLRTAVVEVPRALELSDRSGLRKFADEVAARFAAPDLLPGAAPFDE